MDDMIKRTMMFAAQLSYSSVRNVGSSAFYDTEEDCELNIHRVCSKVLDEDCLGPHTHNKSKAHQSDRISKFMGKIRPTHHFIAAERTRRQEEESMEDSSQQNDRPTSVSLGRNPSDRRPEHPAADKSEGADGGDPVDHEMVNESPKPCKSAPVSVNRSESYKERLSQKRNMRNQRRKTSDPNLSKTSDDALDITALSQATCSGSSSTCSLSSSSPQSLSLETVGGPGGRSHGTAVDSDDAEEGSDWASLVPPEVLARLSDKEKKRQEVINELIQTERSHVRKLRLLERLFYRPLLESGLLPLEQLQLLFPQSFKSLQELHGSFSQRIKQRQKEGGHLVGFIGDLLISMFDGPAGEELKASAASFCERQQIALEGLKERRRKDGRLQSLLNEAESDQACRRLQLKDLLPTGHQRLTKYPLLFESLVKCYDKDTLESDPSNEAELQSIQRAVELSKQILNHVNHAVRVAEDCHRLQTIQKKLDRSGFDKVDHSIVIEFRNLDLTQHRLIYEGTLILRLDGKRLQLHAVLLNEVIVLLQKQDDKYLMKFHQGGAGGSEGSRIERASPIIKLATLIIREKATDKNTFFLIVTSHSQMYEFVTQTTSEYKAWFKHISEAAEAYKSKPKLPYDVDADSLQDTSIDNTSLDSASIDNNLDNASNDTSVTDTVADNPSESSEFEKIAHNDIDTQSRTDTEGSISVDNGESDVTKDDKRLSGEILADGDSVTGTQYLTQTSSLVAPSEVKISVSPVHLAEPVLTTYERLRRADIAVRNALELKQRIVGEILSIPPEDYTVIADMASMGSAAKEPTEIILNALQQAQQLTHIINDSYTVNEQQVVLSTQLKTNTWSQLCDKCEFKSKEMDIENIETCNDENSEPELVEATNLLVDQVVLSDTIVSDGSTSIINAQEIMEMTESGEIFEDAVGNIDHKNHDGGIFSQFSQTCRGCDFVDQQVKPVVSTHKVLDVANDINSTLTQLLQIVRERDNEREALRKELQRCRELLHHFHGQASQFSNDDVTTPECAEKTEDTIN